jgi:uncharacterized protein
MNIDPQQFKDESEKRIRDSVPAAELEIDEPTVRATAPAEVDLTARRLGSEILIQGKVDVTLQAQCGRCAEWIPWPVHLEEFATSLAVTTEQPIDLTPFLREDILLALPVVTCCDLDAENRCVQSGRRHPVKKKAPVTLHENVWQALDKLKKTKD